MSKSEFHHKTKRRFCWNRRFLDSCVPEVRGHQRKIPDVFRVQRGSKKSSRCVPGVKEKFD